MGGFGGISEIGLGNNARANWISLMSGAIRNAIFSGIWDIGGRW
jgi:hypothetical protein